MWRFRFLNQRCETCSSLYTPAACKLEYDGFLEIVEDLKNVGRYELFRCHALQVGSIYRTDYQMIIAHKFWYAGGEEFR